MSGPQLARRVENDASLGTDGRCHQPGSAHANLQGPPTHADMEPRTARIRVLFWVTVRRAIHRATFADRTVAFTSGMW